MNDIAANLGYIVGVGSVLISAVVVLASKSKYETNAKLDSATIAAQERLIKVTENERDQAIKGKTECEKQAAVYKAESTAKDATIANLKEYNSKQPDFSRLTEMMSNNHKEITLKLTSITDFLVKKPARKKQ